MKKGSTLWRTPLLCSFCAFLRARSILQAFLHEDEMVKGGSAMSCVVGRIVTVSGLSVGADLRSVCPLLQKRVQL